VLNDVAVFMLHRFVTLKAQTVPESVSPQGVLYFWNLEHKAGVDELAVTILQINAVTAVWHVPLSLVSSSSCLFPAS